MALFTDGDVPESFEVAEGCISDMQPVVRMDSATWLPAQGELANVLLELSQRPGLRFLRVGETEDVFLRPLYLARAAHKGSIYPGICGFHIAGARINVDGRELIAPRYEVLVGTSDEFQWLSQTESAAAPHFTSLVVGFLQHDTPNPDSLFLARYRRPSGRLGYGRVVYRCKGFVSETSFYSLEGGSSQMLTIEDVEKCELSMLFHIKPAQVPMPAPHGLPQSDDSARVTIGRYYTANDWRQVKHGDRYLTAVNFTPRCEAVPTIVLGFRKLDMEPRDCALCLRLYTQSVTRDSFICNAESWGKMTLINCDVSWAVIDEPSWQTGVFRTTAGSNLSNNRITFSPPFTSPPIVFVCFSGLDMVGMWDFRLDATNVDHAGFDLSLLNSKNAKVGSVSVAWIAIPGEDILKRKNAWIGRFTTDAASEKNGKNWDGRVKFPFAFKRPPNIFVCVDQLSFDNEHNVGFVVETSKVTTTGMDWNIWHFGPAVLRGVGANFLAVDCA